MIISFIFRKYFIGVYDGDSRFNQSICLCTTSNNADTFTYVKETRVDNMIKNSGFGLITRPDFEPERSGAGRVGFDLPRVGFFRLGSPLGAKLVGRIGFQIFEFFDHPSMYILCYIYEFVKAVAASSGICHFKIRFGSLFVRMSIERLRFDEIFFCAKKK